MVRLPSSSSFSDRKIEYDSFDTDFTENKTMAGSALVHQLMISVLPERLRVICTRPNSETLSTTD